MADDYRPNIPPGNFPKEESRQQIEFPRENRFFSFLKNVLIFLVLVGIVVASFMVSFQLGKKILVPTKKAPEKITAAIPETPPSLKSLQKLQALMSAEAVGKEAKKAAPKKHKRHCRKSGAAGRHARGSYYKIQAGLFADKAQAAALAETMKTAGIDIYIKKVGGSWRVQAGAYKTKDMADKAAAEVEAKGFKSQVIFE